MKDTLVKRLWNLPLWIQRAAKARHVAGESLYGSPQRPLFEVVEVKLVLHWRPCYFGDTRAMRHLPKGVEHRGWKQPKREACSRTGEMKLFKLFHVRHGATGLGVYHAEFWVCFGPVFFSTMLSVILFEMEMCIYAIVFWIYIFCFFISWGLQLRDCLESQKNFGLLNSVGTKRVQGL